MVLLPDQDRSQWDRALIAEGHELVRRCLRRNAPGPYQIQAAINAVHTDAPTAADTDWRQIVQLYDQLQSVEPSPVVALNRAVAVAELEGPAVALDEVDALDLDAYHLFHSTRADLLGRLGRYRRSARRVRARARAHRQRRRAHAPRAEARRATGRLTRPTRGSHRRTAAAAAFMSCGRSSRARSPLAARLVHEVAAVHVDRAGEPVRRVGDRMDHVVPSTSTSPAPMSLPPESTSRPRRVGIPPEERVFFAAAVDADRGPHPVVVRVEAHLRSPNDVDDREVGPAVQELEPAVGRAQRVGHRGRVGDARVRAPRGSRAAARNRRGQPDIRQQVRRRRTRSQSAHFC